MAFKTNLQSDFDTILGDFGISTTIPGTTAAVTAVRNTLDKEVTYSEMSNQSVEYKFTLWYDVSDITAAGATVPEVHDEITVDGTVYFIGRRSYDPVEAIVSFDMVEQYG